MLSQMQRMIVTGGHEMVSRFLPQVRRLLQGSSAGSSRYDFDATEELTTPKEVRIEAYKLLINMAAFVPVDFSMQMLVNDITEMTSPDFNIVNQALLAAFNLPHTVAS